MFLGLCGLFILFCLFWFGWVLLGFFPFGACQETEFRTGDNLGFYLLINFPIGWREGNNYCDCSCLCYTERKIALSCEMHIAVYFAQMR